MTVEDTAARAVKAGAPPASAPAGGGFVLSRVYKLAFEDEYEGLEVRMRGLSVDQVLEAMSLASLAQADVMRLDDEEQGKVESLFTMFATRLVSWNVMEEVAGGERVPVPATLAGVRGQDFAGILHIVVTWLTAVGGVSKSLGKGSTGGVPSAVLNLPMEPPSTDPSS